MSALGAQTLINQDRALYLSSIPTDIIHGEIICDTILANAGFISTLFTENLNVSSLKASTLSLTTSDVSGMFVSSLRGNTAFFSSMTLASDLSGGVGFVRFSVDASGIQVDGDPIRFDNLVYLTSTINIIQVSTLVDTDIFASNGYFSTLSSGSFSSGLASIQDANISSLFVSSLTALDLSGDFAERWSAYPTLNSSIIFQPAYVLSNVNQKLYFAGQELTDASGGGLDWSYFPAQTDVSMNNFSLRGLSTLQYQDGATLVSQTGNNLLYNGQPVQFGATSNVSQWANYPAVNTIQTGGFPISSLGNLTVTANSNVRILADSFSTVADQGLLSPTANSDINLTAQNGLKGRINLTANPGALGLFGEINMTANGGTVAGVGTGGLVSITANTPVGTLCNATSAIKLSASGVNSYAGVVPPIGSLAGYNFIYGSAGVNIASGIPSVFPNVPLTTYLYGTAGVTTESDFYVPNIYPYWNGLTTPPDLNITGRYIVPNLAQVYVNLSNVKNLSMDGTAQMSNLRVLNMSNGTGIITDVSTINGVPFGQVLTQSNIVCSNVLATVSVNTDVVNSVSTIATNSVYCPGQMVGSTILWNFALGISSVFNNIAVNNIKVADDITGVTNAPMPLESRIVNFSSINSFNVSTTDLWVSSINGLPIDPSGTPLITVSTFNDVKTSTLNVSSISQFGGVPLEIIGSLKFANPSAIDYVDVINLNSEFPLQLDINASTIFIGGNNVTMNSVSTNRLQANAFYTSSLSTASLFASNATVSSLSAVGGLGIKVTNPLEFVSLDAITNVAVINLNPPAVPALAIGASTITLDANNVRTNSLSTISHSTSALQFSTATSVGSNSSANYPIFIDYDHAGGATNASVVAIAVQGHNLGTGAVRNQIEFGARGNGENYIMSVWPGQNLEELFIDATDVTFRDSDGFSTIINANPYGIQTNGKASIGVGSGIVEISTNNVKVGGVNQMTSLALSSVIINTPYGNNIYNAGLQQPAIQFGTVASSGGSGSVSVTLATPHYANSNYVVQATMRDTNTAQMSALPTSQSSFTLYWSSAGGGSHSLDWTTFGNLPFTG